MVYSSGKNSDKDSSNEPSLYKTQTQNEQKSSVIDPDKNHLNFNRELEAFQQDQEATSSVDQCQQDSIGMPSEDLGSGQTQDHLPDSNHFEPQNPN